MTRLDRIWIGTPIRSRRAVLSGGAAGLVVLALSACGNAAQWHEIDVTGASPPLRFTMQRTGDAKTVTASAYRGEITLLYFGYTFCPDVCPTTLANLAEILARLGRDTDAVRVLFVTVDPHRDTLAVLTDYVANFGQRVVGLRGTPDEIAALARRYRIAYSVSPGDADHPYEVTHSSAVYVFDREGNARLLIASLGTGDPDIAGAAEDLKRLIHEG